MHWEWSWPVCNRPSLWDNQQWLEWCCNYLFSNRLILIDQLQSPSKGLSIGALVLATIEDQYKDCGKLVWRPNKHHSHSRRPWGRGKKLANSTCKPAAHKSLECQNGRLKNCHDAGWSAPFKWPWVQTWGPGGEKFPWVFCSHLGGLIAALLELQCWSLAALGARVTCHQCWLYKGLCWLARYGKCSKIGVAAVEHRFYK